jgi:hypothetical protein
MIGALVSRIVTDRNLSTASPKLRGLETIAPSEDAIGTWPLPVRKPSYWWKREKYFRFKIAINVAGHLRTTTF